MENTLGLVKTLYRAVAIFIICYSILDGLSDIAKVIFDHPWSVVSTNFSEMIPNLIIGPMMGVCLLLLSSVMSKWAVRQTRG